MHRNSLRSRVVVAILFSLGFAANAEAVPVSLVAPAGLSDGDRFRFAFVTNGSFYGSTGTIDALSSDINSYNAFVNAQAAGATFQGATVNWKAIGSTATVHARDNVGGFGSLVPVYLVNGTRISNDLTTGTGGFWSGYLLGTTNLDTSIDGTIVGSYVWTGSQDDGLGVEQYELGSGDYTQYGDSTEWGGFIDYDSDDGSYTAPMFAMSEELQVGVVPEIDPAGATSIVGLLGGVLGLLERRTRRVRG